MGQVEQDRIKFRRAWDLLANGAYLEGFARFEEVRFRRGTAPSTKPALSFPEWMGQPVKSLLIVPEQGLGDQIQFARFVPQLLARGIDVTLLASPALTALFECLGCKVLSASGQVAIPAHDAWIMAGSLPHRLEVTLDNLSGASYLRAPPGRLKSAPSNLRIGVVWRGNPNHGNDRHRSMTALAAAPLLAIPGAVCLHPEVTKARDFADTAAIIEHLNAVVSIDTSVAHLAGALGKRTLLMLPAHEPDWRWLKGRSDSPWYQSMQLYRQTRDQDWSDVTAAVVSALSKAP